MKLVCRSVGGGCLPFLRPASQRSAASSSLPRSSALSSRPPACQRSARASHSVWARTHSWSVSMAASISATDSARSPFCATSTYWSAASAGGTDAVGS